MSFTRAVASLCAVLLLSLATAAHATWSTDPTVNLPVCTAPGTQAPYQMVPDTSGGAYVVWTDYRGTNAQVYATHILKTGTLDPTWTVNGTPVGTGAGDQATVVAIADGSNGMYVAWEDKRNGTYDIYLQHMNPQGGKVTGWSGTGVLAGATVGSTSVAVNDLQPSLARDNSGGVYVVWTSIYNSAGGDLDVWGNHFTSAGAYVSGWGTGLGRGLDRNSGEQSHAVAYGDPSGNLLVAAMDNAGGNFDIHGYSYLPNGNAGWAGYLDGGSGDQRYPVIFSDGSNGAMVAYYSQNSTPGYLAMTDFNVTSALWGAVMVSPTLTVYGGHAAISDGLGGAYIEWDDLANANLIHVNNVGTTAPGWPTSGIALDWVTMAMVPDASHGVIVADASGSQPGARRYTANGQLVSGWALPSLFSSYYSAYTVMTTDGQGGVIAAWADSRNFGTSGYDVYAQRLDRFGKLGDSAPAIAKIKDVPNDQGGHVTVRWSASALDVSPTPGIYQYLVYRQVPAFLATNLVGNNRARIAGANEPAGTFDGVKALRTTTLAGTTYYWELAATVSAQMLAGYSQTVSTASDSVGGSNPYTLYMVEATNGLGAFWQSSPDSGYSVDNLAPVAPAPFTGTFHAGVGTQLSWLPNAEGDLAGYRLYKGSSAGFTPGPGNRIASLSGLASFTDPSQQTGWYKLSAVDIHGNESAFSTLMPAGVTAVTDAAPRELAFALAGANPVRGAAALRLALPVASHVRVEIFDAAGRLVRTLADESRAAGVYTIAWDGADASGGPVASGLFFARLETPARTLVTRLAVTR